MVDIIANPEIKSSQDEQLNNAQKADASLKSIFGQFEAFRASRGDKKLNLQDWSERYWQDRNKFAVDPKLVDAEVSRRINGLTDLLVTAEVPLDNEGLKNWKNLLSENDFKSLLGKINEKTGQEVKIEDKSNKKEPFQVTVKTNSSSLAPRHKDAPKLPSFISGGPMTDEEKQQIELGINNQVITKYEPPKVKYFTDEEKERQMGIQVTTSVDQGNPVPPVNDTSKRSSAEQTFIDRTYREKLPIIATVDEVNPVTPSKDTSRPTPVETTPLLERINLVNQDTPILDNLKLLAELRPNQLTDVRFQQQIQLLENIINQQLPTIDFAIVKPNVLDSLSEPLQNQLLNLVKQVGENAPDDWKVALKSRKDPNGIYGQRLNQATENQFGFAQQPQVLVAAAPEKKNGFLRTIRTTGKNFLTGIGRQVGIK